MHIVEFLLNQGVDYDVGEVTSRFVYPLAEAHFAGENVSKEPDILVLQKQTVAPGKIQSNQHKSFGGSKAASPKISRC
jgi:hypothetical protein